MKYGSVPIFIPYIIVTIFDESIGSKIKMHSRGNIKKQTVIIFCHLPKIEQVETMRYKLVSKLLDHMWFFFLISVYFGVLIWHYKPIQCCCFPVSLYLINLFPKKCRQIHGPYLQSSQASTTGLQNYIFLCLVTLFSSSIVFFSGKKFFYDVLEKCVFVCSLSYGSGE